MAPSRKDKGKKTVVEDSQQDNVPPRQSVKKRRLMATFQQRALIEPKCGNLISSPSTSFQFPTLLEYQRITGPVEDSRIFYQDMVKEFCANFSVEPGCVL